MDFLGFSPASFEQFIRALAIKILGPGVTIFGNGPDGGREASFKGVMPYPFPSSQEWNGYGVIQAKFKEKIEGTKLDNAWAKKQLEDELISWTTSNKRKPKPEYYIYCTNVDLTSAASGGKDQLNSLLNDYSKKLGLKDFAVWDANQLKTYIDSYEDIRRRFFCFFTTGDLLHDLSKLIPNAPNPDVILTSYLCKELLVDEDAKLSQAGDRSEDRIRLANVFVDLPSSATPALEPLRGDETGPASLHNLLKVASRKLDPLSIYEQRHPDDGTTSIFHSRFLFLGGPGSGKSTIGQFLAQIHRAAILERRPSYRLESRTIDIIKGIKANCEQGSLPWPATPRFPFRVDLNAFAKALTLPQDKVLSLSDYLRRGISRDFTFTHEDLREWLRIRPSVLILDGLDEVPSSSNRNEVIVEIQIFLNEMRDIEADLLVVASSRPEGYSGEFDSDEVAKRYLAPLSRTRAMYCAQKYVSAKIGSLGEQRGEEALEILKTAVENHLIARLMRSPLQVTFMVTVVAASGKPSESRWQLFNDYYRIIYERELHKAVRPFNNILSSRRQDIDSLHHKVGFVLQCRAELSGSTQADLPVSEFEGMVSEFLQEAGLSFSDSAIEREMILGAANSRLVFLTSRVPNRLSFDVRSLQEYMAAACMTSTDAENIIRVLETIAHSAYWRNTILFAVGRFFAESQLRNYRDRIQVLCENLNMRNAEFAQAKVGSILALDILESGAVGHLPMVLRSLSNCALGLLSTIDEDYEVLQSLADVYDDSVISQYQENIEIWLGQVETNRTLSAWILLLLLEKRNIPWAIKLTQERWPNNRKHELEILKRWLPLSLEYTLIEGSINEHHDVLNQRDTARLRDIIFYINPEEFSEWGLIAKIHSDEKEDDWLQQFINWMSSENHADINAELTVDGERTNFNVTFKGLPSNDEKELFSTLRVLSNEIENFEHWEVLSRCSDFYIDPSAHSLSKTLQQLAGFNDIDGLKWLIPKLSWPLQCCLKFAQTREGLINLADYINKGFLGDFKDWQQLEDRWSSDGISIDEAAGNFYTDGPFIASGIIRGMIKNPASDVFPPISRILNLITADTPIIRRRFYTWIIVLVSDNMDVLIDLPPKVLSEKIFDLGIAWYSHSIFPSLRFENCDDYEWFEFFDKFGRTPNLQLSPLYWSDWDLYIPFLVKGYEKDRSRSGLLCLISCYCAGGMPLEWDLQCPIDLAAGVKDTLSMILIKIADPNLTKEDANIIADLLPEIFPADARGSNWDLLVTALENHCYRVPNTACVLSAVTALTINTDWKTRSKLQTIQKRIIETRPSGFNENLLRELGLPSITEKSSRCF